MVHFEFDYCIMIKDFKGFLRELTIKSIMMRKRKMQQSNTN